MIKFKNVSCGLSTIFIFLICFIILASFLKIIDYFPLPELTEPANKNYRSDEMIFLKTFYLMKKNKSYYEAFKQANEEDLRGKSMGKDVFTWRWPTIFYLWKFTANNGQHILRNFYLLALFSLIAVFLILRKFVNFKLAILGVFLLIPYFADTFIYQTSFLFTEWWAWFFFIIGLAFWLYQKIIPTWIFFFLAVATRELMIIPILFFLIYSFYLKIHRFFFFSIIFLFIFFLLFHQSEIYLPLANAEDNFNILAALSRFHLPNKLTTQRILAFSMRQYPLIKYKSHYFIIFLGILSLIINLIKKKKAKDIYYIFLAGWSLFLILPFITSSQHNDYWGILFMPTLILTVPLIFSKNA